MGQIYNMKHWTDGWIEVAREIVDSHQQPNLI